MPDFDHRVKENNVEYLLIAGLLTFTIFYLLKLPYFAGILMCLLAVIFYFSNHRGFTHSILGIAILSTLVFLIVTMGSSVILSFRAPIAINDFLNSFYHSVDVSLAIKQIAIGIMVLLLGILSLNKKLAVPFITLFTLSLFLWLLFFSQIAISYVDIILSAFLGFLSHLILDSFTPSGIEVFRPFSSKKVHKKFGIAMLCLLGGLAILKFVFILKLV